MASQASSARKKTESTTTKRRERARPAAPVTPLYAGTNIFAADTAPEGTETANTIPFDASQADAAALQALLRERIEPGAAEAETSDEQTETPKPAAAPPARPRYLSRLIKAFIGLAIIAIAGWMPAQRLFQVSSVEAVVNARLVTVRSPINGVVGIDTAGLTVGEPVSAGGHLARITNPRADRYRLDDAIAELGDAREERDALAAKLKNLQGLRTDLAAQLAAFRDNRIRQIDARVAEADARIAAAEAVLGNVEQSRRRQATLTQKGFVAQTTLEDATREASVAQASADEARAQRAALMVERDALGSGVYVGDSYNDEPRSAQRLDEIAQAIGSIRADLARQEARVTRAEAALKRERDAYALVRTADLSAPVSGRVWEVLTAPGEQVAAGQALFSVLNCAQPLVTAAVSEAVYNSLSVGMPARFIFREGGEAMPGHVVQLSGVASASSNFAIVPSALTKESYRVAVSLDDAPNATACSVGRTGRVVFGAAGQ